jgi:hypothetical protein
MVPAIIVAEKYRRMKGVFVSAVAALVISQIMLYLGSGNVFVLLAALIVFFSAFNVMEASLPSLITKVAPPDVKGTAMGVYSSLQFLGIFMGGIIGGVAHQHGGSAGVFALTTALAAIWLLTAARSRALFDDSTAADRRRQCGGRREPRDQTAAGPRRVRSRDHNLGCIAIYAKTIPRIMTMIIITTAEDQPLYRRAFRWPKRPSPVEVSS